ncbi:DUF2637 domain-containing protein [Streptomyces galbus]|uniref:DUF2637 domain-containing protein n=1 Tax=Streptomyces galbus TaxID=33898 RepID=UPI0038049CBF
MSTFQWSLSAGLAVAGIGAATVVALLLGSRRRASEQHATADERAAFALQRRHAWQRRLAVTALGIGCVMMFVLAGIAAWLSFGAQREYAHAHNGGDWDAATGFALLLDAGALSLSLIRFFEALTLRSSAITRILLLAFVSASAAMNLLHAPGAGSGSAFLAVVPPLVYAILLEMLLYKIEQVIMGRQKRRTADPDRGYSLLLWLPWPIGAPVRMWKAWRSELLATVDNVRVIGSQRPRPSAVAASAEAEVIVERADPPAALANVLLATASRASTEEGEGALLSEVIPPTSSAVPPPGERTSATAVDQETPQPAAVAEARLEAAPELKAAPKSKAELKPEVWRSLKPEQELFATAEVVEKEPDPQHDEENEEAREGLRIEIDLSVLPKNLTHRQRAERIYIAHQAAGVALAQADLGKWAGYKNPNSGGNEYRRLEKQYGPIMVREGATHSDLNFSYEQEAA